MSRGRRIAFVAIAGIVAGSVARIADPTGTSGALVFLAAGLVLGELLVLRLENDTAVPLSYAVLIVLASSFPVPQYAAAVAGAELISLLLRFSDHASGIRARILCERMFVAAATIAAYEVGRAIAPDETVAALLFALGAAALAQVVVDLVARWVLSLPPTLSERARLAWLAIASSGMLMAIGYRGVGGKGQIGIWGPVLFSTPLLAAWYAFERLNSATLAYDQTIEALAMAPEFGRLVPPGHSERVAVLSVAMATDLGLSASDTSDLKMAARLHHLGQVILDEPDDSTPGPTPSRVAEVTSAMLREIEPLAGAGDIVSGDTSEPRRRVAVQVLRVASEYDDLTVRDSNDASDAIELLRSAPGYVYDEKVLAALEQVTRTGVNIGH